MSPPPNAVIRLTGIHRQFMVGDQVVHGLKSIDLRIDSGEYVAIMGPSGSGKSTLLNAISLLDRPDSGVYELLGRKVTELNDQQLAQVRRENIGFVFQFFHLIPRLTARENIEIPLILAGSDPETRNQRVSKAIDDYGLKNRADHRPNQLSGGQRQRVAIARATIMQPGILLADEPTGNLDQQSGTEIVELLEGLNRSGVTLLLVTHDPALGERANRQIRMLDGRIVGDSNTTTESSNADH